MTQPAAGSTWCASSGTEEDILRIIGSIHTGAVRAYDVIRMLSRDGRPTPLGDAIAHYGRISKSLHILRLADEPGYRRAPPTRRD